MKKPVLSLFLFAVYCFAVYSFFNVFLAELLSKQAKNAFKSGDTLSAYVFASRAIELNPNEPNYYQQRAQAELGLTAVTTFNSSPTDLKKLALSDLYAAENINPKNYATLRDNLPFYYFLAINDLTQPVANNIDKFYSSIAQDYFGYLKRNFPNDVGLWVDIAKYEKKLGMTSEYAATLEQIKGLRPDLLIWHSSIIGQ